MVEVSDTRVAYQGEVMRSTAMYAKLLGCYYLLALVVALLAPASIGVLHVITGVVMLACLPLTWRYIDVLMEGYANAERFASMFWASIAFVSCAVLHFIMPFYLNSFGGVLLLPDIFIAVIAAVVLGAKD